MDISFLSADEGIWKEGRRGRVSDLFSFLSMRSWKMEREGKGREGIEGIQFPI